MSFHKLYHLFFSWKGEIGRSVYAFTGIILFLVKWNLDRLFSFFANEVRYPTPFFYLLPEISSETVRTDLILPCFGIALPFIYLGLVLTVKRLRSLGWPIYSSILFFVPFVNLLFFFLLSILPQNSPLEWNRKNRPRTKEWLDRFLPRGKVACASLAMGLSATLGTLFVSLSLLTGVGQDYGWGFFVGLPFAMGLTSAVTYGHHERRSLWACLGVALLTLGFSFLLLLLLAIEGILCLLMAAPIALPLAAVGGWVGYLVQNRAFLKNPSLSVFVTTFLLMGFEEKALPEAPPLRGPLGSSGECSARKGMESRRDLFRIATCRRLAFLSWNRLPNLRYHRGNGCGSNPPLQLHHRRLRGTNNRMGRTQSPRF